MHVFLINNPIVLMVSCLVIRHRKIPMSEVLTVPVRGMDCGLLAECRTISSEFWQASSVSTRLALPFRIHLPGRKLRKVIEKRVGDYFSIYCFWASSSVRELLKSTKCHAHYYLEEGTMSYLERLGPAYSSFAEYFHKRVMKGNPARYYLPSAAGYFSIGVAAFPNAPCSRKHRLDPRVFIDGFYQPKLAEVEDIILIPYKDPKKVNWAVFWQQTLRRIESRNIILQLHPGHRADSSKVDSVMRTIPDSYRGKCQLSPSGTILEGEMLHSKKRLYGSPHTSLKRYASQFGSDFIDVHTPLR